MTKVERDFFSLLFFFLNNLTVDNKPGIEYFLRWNYFDLFDTIEKMLSVWNASFNLIKKNQLSTISIPFLLGIRNSRLRNARGEDLSSINKNDGKREKRLRERGDFSKDREAIKDIGGFRLARGCLRIQQSLRYNNNGEKRERRKQGRGRETRGSKCAILDKHWCVLTPPPPSNEQRNDSTDFFFFFFTHARRESRVRHRRSELPEKRSHASLKTLKPLLRLPSFPPPFPPFVLMNGNRSVGFRVCAPLVAHRSHEEGG